MSNKDLNKQVQALQARFKYLDGLCKTGYHYDEISSMGLPELRHLYEKECLPVHTGIVKSVNRFGQVTVSKTNIKRVA